MCKTGNYILEIFNIIYIIAIGPSTTTETETIAKYEIMDGAPVKGNMLFICFFCVIGSADSSGHGNFVSNYFCSVRIFMNS